MTTQFTRSWALNDIRIRSDVRGGDGKTGRVVEAYAAVFGSPAEVYDQDGHYREQIEGAAFRRTLAHNGTDFKVLFNHGMTVWGTPAERWSLPIGTPVEMRTDTRGLLTLTEYNRTPQAEEVLEAIRSGGITAYSFTGAMLRSTPRKPPGGYRPGIDGQPPLVTRSEISLKEYGPATFAVYNDAAVVGVRAQALLGALLAGDPTEAANLLQQMRGLTTPSADSADSEDRSGTPPDGELVADTAGATAPRPSTPLSERIRAAKLARNMK